MSSPNSGPAAKAPARAAPRSRPLRLRLQLWARWLHVYTSMVSLLLTLFFALSGIAVNHPEWLPAGVQRQHEYTGTLPAGWRPLGRPDWLNVAETLRERHRLEGRATDFQEDRDEDSFAFKGPGYSADVSIEVPGGQYRVSAVSQGALAVIGDLHRGRSVTPAWKWVIDLSGGFLALVALTGLLIMLYLKKLRRAALLTLLGGAAAALLLAKLAT